MSRFDQCLAFVLKQEGGYTNGTSGDSKFDSGGATNCGITQAVYDDYRARAGRNRQPVVGITATEVADIYRSRYWKAVAGDSLPMGLDLVVFDAAVNLGVSQSSKFLQRAVGVDDDGFIGQQTINAVVKDNVSGLTPKVIGDCLDQRRDFYEKLVVRKPTNKVFIKGWLNRIEAVKKEIRL